MPPAVSNTPGALDGLHVLEFGQHIAASYCSKLLADLGAQVWKVEGPGGDPLRSFGPIDPTGPEPTSGLFHYLNANKQGGLADLRDPKVAVSFLEAAERVDMVIENFSPGIMESFGLGPDELGSANARLVYVRISSYGQTGPWRHRVASDLTLQAETGMGLRLGEPGGQPISIAGRLSEYIGGTFAASAALAALHRAQRCGTGTVVDVSLLETLLCSLSPTDVVDEYLTAYGIERSEKQRVMPGFVPCLDGEVCVSVLTGQNWADLCLLIGRPEWMDQMREIQTDEPLRAKFMAALSDWTRPRDSNDVITTMQSCRISAATAADGRTLLQQPPFLARGFLVPQPGTSFVRPAAPYRLSETPVTVRSPAPRLSPVPAIDSFRTATGCRPTTSPSKDVRPLEGVRVVDLTTFLSGGQLTGSLAALGADVIKVESSHRPDSYRFIRAYPEMGSHWWERSPYWWGQNFAKRNLALDLNTDEGRAVLSRLIATADVMAENFTPRVVEGFGFGYEQVRALNPKLIMVRMPAFGLEGPWRDYAGFAYNIEQVAGMAQNGFPDGPLVQPAGIVDIVNGQHALVATLAALRYREVTGKGQLIEVAQVETVACLCADQAIEFQLTGRCRERIGNRSPMCAPQGIYPCREDRWIAVTVATEEQWQALGDELSLPASVRHLDLVGRQAHHEAIDELVAGWTRGQLADDAVNALQAGGIAAGVLALLPEMRNNPQLRARHYYRQVEQPYGGVQRCARPPVRFGFGEVVHGPAPTLGQHNDEVLRELGFDAEQIEDLRRRDVIAEGLQT